LVLFGILYYDISSYSDNGSKVFYDGSQTIAWKVRGIKILDEKAYLVLLFDSTLLDTYLGYLEMGTGTI
jgi:hypothetical protein